MKAPSPCFVFSHDQIISHTVQRNLQPPLSCVTLSLVSSATPPNPTTITEMLQNLFIIIRMVSECCLFYFWWDKYIFYSFISLSGLGGSTNSCALLRRKQTTSDLNRQMQEKIPSIHIYININISRTISSVWTPMRQDSKKKLSTLYHFGAHCNLGGLVI